MTEHIDTLIKNAYLFTMAGDGVGYIADGEVAIQGNRIAARNPLAELVDGHVRTLPGSVDREEAQTRRRQPVQVRVRVRHQLVGLFRGGVEADRMVHVVVDAEGHARVGTVDRAAGGVDEVFDVIVAAAFEDMGDIELSRYLWKVNVFALKRKR